MGRMKDCIRRALRYVIKGVPVYHIEVNTVSVAYGGLLEGRRVLITGGTRGLGFAIARRCIEERAQVTITGRTMEALEKAKERMGNPEGLYLIENDIRDCPASAEVIAHAAEMMGGLDTLINNAGVSVHDITYADCTQEQWDMQVDTNLKGVYFMTQAFLNRYEKEGLREGWILMMASERGLYGDDVPYGMAKRALISYTEGLAVRLITKGIRVNAIAPGVTATDMTGLDPQGNLHREASRGQRVLLPEEIAEPAIFLISRAASAISGQVLACNEANHLKM